MIETVSKQEVYNFFNNLNGLKSYLSKRILFLINNVSLNGIGRPINKRNGSCPVPLSASQLSVSM